MTKVTVRIGELRMVRAEDMWRYAQAAEQIGSERTELSVALEIACSDEFRDRHVEADGDGVRGADEDAHVARRSLPRRSGGVDVPAAVHAHVRAEEQIAGEREQQM